MVKFPPADTVLSSTLSRPQEIDEAARRRLVKRLYIPLPDASARRQIVTNLMQQQLHSLTDEEFDQISQQTDGKPYKKYYGYILLGRAKYTSTCA